MRARGLVPSGAIFAATLLSGLGCGGSEPAATAPKATLQDYRAARTTSAAAPDADPAFRETPPKLLPPRRPAEANPVEAILSNGIRVVMLERHDFPGITANLVLDRGLDASLPRAVELYARTATRASTLYDKRTSSTYLAHVGARVNIAYDRDLVSVSIEALTPLFVSALSRGAPLVYTPALADADLEEARARATADRSNAHDAPDSVGGDTLLEAVFPPNHPYGHTLYGPLGRQSTDVSNDAVRVFRDTITSADHLSVAVVGDFQVATMKTWLETALGQVPRKAKVTLDEIPDVPLKGAPRLIVIDRPGAVQSNVLVGFRGPRATDASLVPVEVLARAAGGTLSARLNVTLRKELGATYGVRMDVSAYRAGGLLRVSTALDAAHTVDGLQKLFAELARFRTEPMSAPELASAKLRAYRPLDNGTQGGLASFLARGAARGIPPAAVVTHDARVDLVNAENVQSAANQYLAPDSAVVVIVGDASKIASGLGTLGLGTPQIEH